jgi:gas vesicle protein
MLHNILTLLTVSAVVWGFFDNPLEFKIRFDQLEGLKEGDRIIFEYNHIGKVSHVSYSKGAYYIADVEISQNFRKAVTENSRFFIITDPGNNRHKAIEMIHLRKGGLLLEGGAVVEGSTRLSALLDHAGGNLEKTMAGLKRYLNQFSEDMRRLPETKEFKKLQRELERLLEEMKRSGSEFREKIQKEVLPRLQEEIEKLKKRLGKTGREKEVKPLEVKMEEMRKI